ncbi:restriction endonuclease subunit S [Ktedonobacter racemifer]|uniref:Restriction modification system DNA specificity domain protein n=1 Tax=Ktedonobacter racemifer DSM 44963 TaxID=485913 RepID=D6TKU8_KTERA|nr:restriction endonuclease subunit S [Ktedonobacter racemifer]EFH86398.1 restriction modification system DNA specificity domain protein [Ktedonobacter racemifer DSM 44963]
MVISTQNSDVKPGYRLTEIGIIPEDWKLKTFRDVSRVNQGLQIAIEKRSKKPTNNSKVYITIQYLNSSKEAEYIDNYTSAVCCGKDDILMTRTGNTGYIVSGVEGVFHNNFFKINYDKAILDKGFLFYYLHLNSTQNIILTRAGASTIPDLNHNDFYSIPIPVPTKSEQIAIAKALSDVDVLTASLDKLIAKKRDIKQATTQQLLTGKIRLPGFVGIRNPVYKQTEAGMIPEDWTVKKLGEVCLYQNGTSLERYFNRNQGLNVISIGNYSIDGNYIDTNSYIDWKHYKEIKKFILNQDELCMVLNDKTSVGAIIGRVLLIKEDNKYVFNQRSMRIKPLDEVLPGYLYYIINSNLIHDKIVSLAKPGTQIYVNTGDITGLDIPFPQSLEEQQAIATILSDMDAEFAALEQRREKTHALKQGMLQELLTGKTRLT